MDGRYQRQAGFLDPFAMAHTHMTVVGVGAVGRQVVHQLVSAGARQITFYDHDIVEEANIGPQGWSPQDIGATKVATLLQEVRLRYPNDDLSGIVGIPSRFPLQSAPSEVIFCCVDGIQTRQNIWDGYKAYPILFLDSRVAGDTIHILSACEEEEKDYYSTTFFAPEDAYQSSCTTKMSIHIANIAAGLLVQQLSKWLRQLPGDRHTVFNLLAMETYSK